MRSTTVSGHESAIELPVCNWREATQVEEEYFCRHTSVRTSGSFVSSVVCSSCQVRNTECDSPRLFSPDIPPPPRPSLAQIGWSVTSAIAAFVADGGRLLSVEQYDERLSICESCEMRRGNRCAKCGCRLALKARAKAFQCPLGKWPELE